MRKIKDNSIVLAIILLSLILILFLQKFGYKSYSRYVSDTLHYNQGIVVEISNENIEYDEGLKLYLGTQDLKVKMTEGNEKGSIIEVTNYLTKTHSVYAKENMRLIINVDTPDDIEPYYTVFNYDRRFSMAACAAILIAAIICISGSKGLKSLAGLLYSMFIIIEFLLPAVFSGWSPTWTSILTAVLSTAVTLLLLNGQSKKTAGAILAFTTGVLCSLILFGVMSALIHIDGFCSSDTEEASADQRKYQSADSRRPICQRVNCISGSYHGRWHVHRLCLVRSIYAQSCTLCRRTLSFRH